MTKRSRTQGLSSSFLAVCIQKDKKRPLYIIPLAFSLKIFSSPNIYVIGTACPACAIGSRTYMKEASAPLKADACWIDDAFNPPTLLHIGPLIVGLMHADNEHNVKSDGSLPSRLFQHPCTSALISLFMTCKHLHKCNYPRTSLGLFYFSIILRARSGQSQERFTARAPRRRAICRKRRALIGMEVAMPVLSGARNLI